MGKLIQFPKRPVTSAQAFKEFEKSLAKYERRRRRQAWIIFGFFLVGIVGVVSIPFILDLVLKF